MPDETARVDQLEAALRVERSQHQDVRRRLNQALADLSHYEAGHEGFRSDCGICRGRP